jgi:hypothetical protein
VKLTADHITRDILDRMSHAERKALTDGLYLAAGDLLGDPPHKPETIAIIDHGLASILPEWVVEEITTKSTKHTKGM